MTITQNKDIMLIGLGKPDVDAIIVHIYVLCSGGQVDRLQGLVSEIPGSILVLSATLSFILVGSRVK